MTSFCIFSESETCFFDSSAYGLSLIHILTASATGAVLGFCSEKLML